MPGDSGEDGMSLTELLSKELESEEIKSQSNCDGQPSRDGATPAPAKSWQADLLQPSSTSPSKGQSFMEVLDGEVKKEVDASKASDSQNLSVSCSSSVAPLPRTLPNTAVPPPTMMSVPPPTVMKLPPPNLMTVPPPNVMKLPPPNLMRVPPPNVMKAPPPNVIRVPPPNVMKAPPPVANNIPPITNSIPPPSMMKVPPPIRNSVPPPAMLKVPPPVSNNIPPLGINVPPPNLQFSRPPFPPISQPPLGIGPMMPVNCPPIPPPVPPFMNSGFRPVGPGHSFSPMPYYGYSNSGNNGSFSELPISVAEIPDTTLATQLKLKKKKKTKKESKDASNGIIFTGSPTKSPINNWTKNVLEISPSVASILPPPPRPPKVVAPIPESSPAEVKAPYLKHVKEHKLVVKVDKRTLKEKTLPVAVPEKKRAIVAEYDSESDDDRYDVESYRKRALHRSITSVRLDENEALPDLYSKLKKLNEELALLQHNEASKSSESDMSDSSCKEGSPKLKKMKSCDTKCSETQSKDHESSTGRTSPLVISDENHGNCRPKLDVRIKMMMDDKMPPVKVEPSAPKCQTIPTPIAPTEELLDPKGRTVAFDSLPPPSANSISITNNLFPPLDRVPSPFLSEEIYQYWQKESIKFRKFLKKTPKFAHIDPYVKYKFRKNRFAPVAKNTQKSSESVNIYSTLDKKLANDSESQEKKATSEHEKAVVTAEIDEDLKRLEAITKELQMLEEEEKRLQREAMAANDDDEDVENSSESKQNSNETKFNDPLTEVSDDLKRLEEIQRQLRELEEEEEEEEDTNADPLENEPMECDLPEYVDINANEKHNKISKNTSDASDSAIALGNARVAESLSDKILKKQEKSNNTSESLKNSLKLDDISLVKHSRTDVRGMKRLAEEDLISLVMSSVMEELKKDLKSSIANSLLRNQHAEVDRFSRKKRKTLI